jgi:hypothetical protein
MVLRLPDPRVYRVDRIVSINSKVVRVLDIGLNIFIHANDINSGNSGVSSYSYFYSALQMLPHSKPSDKRSLLEGYISSAGMGSETIVQASRLALYDYFYDLPLQPELHVKTAYTLLDASTTIRDVLSDNLNDDRVILPLLEVIAFLLDAQLLQRLSTTSFKYVYPTSAHFLC